MSVGLSSSDLLEIAAFVPSVTSPLVNGPTGAHQLIVDPMGVTGFMSSDQSNPHFIPYTPPAAPIEYIMTIADLISSREALVRRKADDTAIVSQLSAPNEANLRSSLFQWAGVGFPGVYPVLSIYLTPPETCIDGVSRPLFDYIPYLTGKTIAEMMEVVQAKLNGIQLSYSLPTGGVVFHVTKL